jgi:hypothetical protein
MADNNGAGFAALSLHIVTMGLLVKKGIISQTELREAIDAGALLMEELGLASGEEGAAIHAHLGMILAVVSGSPSPTKG